METKNPDVKTLKELQWLIPEKYYTVPPESPGSGGLFLYWKKEINLTINSATKNFTDTTISYKGVDFHTTFVYGEPDQTKRQEVWDELSNLQDKNSNPWYLTGDFNEIIDNSEKCGGPERAEGTFCAFRSFLSTNGLFDLKHCGSSLSWRGKRYKHLVQCRLDRTLCNAEWSDLFPSCRSQYLRYEGSDHRPLVSFLDTRRKKGKGIFRFDRRLKDNEEIKAIIKGLWENNTNLEVEEKLSLCRQAICKWSKEFYENSRLSIETIRRKLDEAMSNPVPDERLLQKLNINLLKMYKEEENFWKQRSRQLWLSLGDSNTEEQISDVICNYYTNLFTATTSDGAQIVQEALKPCITEKQNQRLIRDPTPKEIKEANFALNPDKAPCPDGFSASFFQANWEITGPSVIREIQQFFQTGSLAKTVNHTYVRLIPKHLDAKRAEDYRPIALCNIYYKIISKLLALRLKEVLNSVISENQSAFIPGRVITDNVLITHEVLHYLKSSEATQQCSMAVKTDMSKAYDRIEWRFVYQVLRRLGFHSKWTMWIMECISTVSYAYLINDNVYGMVKPQRGIRQGDPLSPYIFILCGEVLSGLCKKAGREGTLQGIRVARGSPRVNHLLFADDTMFFCSATPEACVALKKILTDYECASGQQINKTKSAITFSKRTPPELKEKAKFILRITREGGEGKYLGVPEHFGRRKRDLFTEIVDRIRQRAASWNNRFLSKAGKLTMMKAVLQAIPTYTMSCFELPISLCKRIQSVLTRFWWDGGDNKRKMSWVAWKKLTRSKAEGGLGFRDIQLFNQALLAKISWRIITTPDCLLARVLKGKYCHRKNFLEVEQPSTCSHGWKGILLGRDLLRDNIGKAIGNGATTRVWKDAWVSLKDQSKPFGPIQEKDLDLRVSDLLTKEIQCLKPSRAGAEDKFIWQHLPSGVYSTRSGYNSVAKQSPEDAGPRATTEFDWIKDIWASKCSPKLRVFMWSIIQGALALGENLQRRGINTEAKCPRCQSTESPLHTFFLCPFAQQVWSNVPLKDEVHIATDDTFATAVVRFRSTICLPPTGIPHTILPWICWSIWKDRNSLIFENKLSQPEEVATKGLAWEREWNKAQTNTKELQSTNLHTDRQEDRGLADSGSEVIICRTDAAWDAARKKAGLAWIFTGSKEVTLSRGSMVQNFVDSPLVAEALAVREGLYTAVNQEFSHIRVYSDNSTLIGAINNKTQRKDLLGITMDIQAISSVFVSIAFFHIPRKDNVEADLLAKGALRNDLV
ncbi:uncharacterized protein LOC111215880 [Brassica napus]|uniref:uncharacterized protein LOC111215880 n=1 Tax=Brassica napus TaxID=3708 RepID=UPI000BBE11A7|nr:uncharacterized protein LOC111215880 [Brassica napus]